MRVPLDWLREYVTVDEEAEALADRLAGVGLPAEAIERVGDEVVLDLEITANRPDCMSVLGVAREVALLLGQRVRRPRGLGDPVRPPRRRAVAAPRRKGAAPVRASARAAVAIEDPVGCPRFTATVIEGVRVGPAPEWMRRRLEAAGVRAVNNVVDVTNYVMLETGQPMHAFDYDRIEGHRLLVRRARPGELLETLDGVSRTLDDAVLVVADAGRAVAVAGIIGGRATEIGPETTTVLLEAAYWDPATISRTARRLGVRTEAGARFERGADPDLPPRAQARAAVLLEEVSGGRVLPGIVDARPGRIAVRAIRLRPDRAVAVLGVEITPGEMVRILRALGCAVTPGRILKVIAPTFRPDLVREEDLIEEVIRVHGYDRVPLTLPRGVTTPGTVVPAIAADRRVRAVLSRCGLVEALTLTLVSSAASEVPLVPVVNPLTQDQDALRRSLVPGLVQVLATNAARRTGDVQVFELGRVFLPDRDGGRPAERRAIAIAAMGRWRFGWNVPADAAVDFYHVRWVLDALVDSLGLPAARTEPAPDPAAAAGHGRAAPHLGPPAWWHPGRTADLSIGGNRVARFGEMHPDQVERYRLPHRAYLAEVDLEALYALASGGTAADPVSDEIGTASVPPRPIGPTRLMRGLPRYPDVERDLAAVVPDDVPAARVEEVIREAAGPLLEAVELFDVYAGAPIPPGRRNLAYRLRLRAPDRTLVAGEAEEILDRVRIAVRVLAGVELRE